jgi:uncharacterized protein (DUF305 family)
MHALKLYCGIILMLIAGCSDAPKTPIDQGSPADQSGGSANIVAGYNAPQQAYHAANGRMHAGMNVINEDADIAFIQGMIPHHRGAVEMANIILQHGDDEEAKALARDIIAAQEKEIAWMKSWLQERGLKEVNPDNAPANAPDHEAMGH